MSMTEDSLSTITLDGNVTASIRQAIADFLQHCNVQYEGYVLDEAWNTKCCQEAINRGIPMDGKYSIRPFMGIGVALTSTCYAHTEHATKMWICLLQSVVIAIDDYLNGELNMEHVYYFNERFVSCQPQANTALSALDTLLREAPCHYSPLVSNLITTSMLDYISSLLVDHETKDMEISTKTLSYPKYWRVLSGFPTALVLFMFPSTLPIQDYIQSIPDLCNISSYTNDILSFYKEEIAGDAANYVSHVAASHAITKLAALHEVIDETVQAHHNILESLKAHSEAYDAYVSYFNGYIMFHGAPRYKLEEIM